MVELERRYRIGELLGLHLAHCEETLSADPEDDVAIAKIREISETYRNFSQGGMPAFRDDFDHGYKLGKWELEQDYEPETSQQIFDSSVDQPS